MWVVVGFSCSSLSLKQNLRHEPESRQVNACFTTLGSRAVACDLPPLRPHPQAGSCRRVTEAGFSQKSKTLWCL